VVGFRVQPWPKPGDWDRGGEVRGQRLRALAALPQFGDDPDATSRASVEFTSSSSLMLHTVCGRRRYASPSFYIHRRFMETRLGFGLFSEATWREHIDCILPHNPNRTRRELERALAFLQEDMDNDEWLEDQGGRFEALRFLVEWALKYRVDVIAALLDADMLHVGTNLLPRLDSDEDSLGFQSQSLMAIATRDVCSPAAVDLLIARGADPETFMYRGGDEPMFGPGGLARRDVTGDWEGRREDKAAIIRSLCRAGACAYLACEQYGGHPEPTIPRRGWKQEHAACWALHEEQVAQRAKDARVKIGNMIALVGIVSFWRRLAAAPGSAAAKKARLRFERAAA